MKLSFTKPSGTVLTRESNNTIKASKVEIPHLESRYSKKVSDIKEATVIVAS